MSNNSDNNARIAKNTLMLYIRMFVTLIVGLFTSRVILDALGIEDYGIYNLVAGFVAMFNILRSGLVSATQRFITYDLGRGDTSELNRTFSTCVIIYIAISVFAVIIAETFGMWFINNKLNIPDTRLFAAHWTFHLSLVMLIVSFISFPYNSLIISHERMNAFAYISIYEVVAKLLLTYLLFISKYDKLIVYSLLMCLVQISIPILYIFYCRKNFVESKVLWLFDKQKVKEIYSYTSWAMLGGFASVGLTQGLNVILGMFFSPIVNAARGIAVQIQGIINSFVSNFQLAMDPQIVKSYARGDYQYMQQLVFNSSKYSFYLLFLLSLPVMLETDMLLSLWLVDIPENTSLFFRLVIITTIYDAFSNPFAKAIQATGKIRNYQLIYSTMLLIIVPISYFFLMLGFDSYIVFVVHIVVGLFASFARIIIASKVTKMNLSLFKKVVLVPISFVVTLSLFISVSLKYFLYESFISSFIVLFVSLLVVLLSIFFCGISKSEQSFFIDKIKSITYFKK